MKKRFPLPVLLLLATGLIIVSVTQIINRKFGLSDGVAGGIMGIGVGLELVAVFLLARHNKMAR